MQHKRQIQSATTNQPHKSRALIEKLVQQDQTFKNNFTNPHSAKICQTESRIEQREPATNTQTTAPNIFNENSEPPKKYQKMKISIINNPPTSFQKR